MEFPLQPDKMHFKSTSHFLYFRHLFQTTQIVWSLCDTVKGRCWCRPYPTHKMHHALSQNLCEAGSQNPSLPTSCASLTLYICLFISFFYHPTLSNNLQQSQYIALMVCWDKVSQVLYLLYAKQNTWSNNCYLHHAHCSWSSWLDRCFVPFFPDVCDWIVRSYKSIFIHQLAWIN